MVEVGAKAICRQDGLTWKYCGTSHHEDCRAKSRAVFSALGLSADGKEE